MDTNELSKIATQGESETVEFKEAFSDRALEAIGAFSNSQGGSIYLGIKDSGEICGTQVGKKTLEDIANRIQEATDPRLQPSIKVIHDGKKSVIVIRVSAGVSAPVSVQGRYFRRTGRTNQKMSHAEILRRMKESANSSWDEEIEARASWNDLDLSKIDQFIENIRKVGRQPIPAQERAQDVLGKLKLIKEGAPTRAAILLFGKDPRHFHFGAYSRVGRFRSPDSDRR
jgi:ATP-dependent DNA helicase RecG